LTVSNEIEFCGGISLETIPKTIQDAIEVTKQLGINYIWVDCLCIIQQGDGVRDWRKHSREMNDIYSTYVLNLSADRGKAANDGFLGKRKWPPLRPIFTKC